MSQKGKKIKKRWEFPFEQQSPEVTCKEKYKSLYFDTSMHGTFSLRRSSIKIAHKRKVGKRSRNSFRGRNEKEAQIYKTKKNGRRTQTRVANQKATNRCSQKKAGILASLVNEYIRISFSITFILLYGWFSALLNIFVQTLKPFASNEVCYFYRRCTQLYKT